MARAMKKVMKSVLADALEANSPKAQRKLNENKKTLDIVVNTTLKGANQARIELEDRWVTQQKIMRKQGLRPKHKDWKRSAKAHKRAMKVWLDHLENIAK